jgi:hypothetical protein
VTTALVAGCSSGTTQTAPLTPPPTPDATSAATPATTAPSGLAGLPYSLEFPDGWVAGTPPDLADMADELERTDSGQARRLRELLDDSPAPTSSLVAYHVESRDAFTPNVGCTTLDRGGVLAETVLDVGEQQNVEAVAQLPYLVGTPTADRIGLSAGETVRVRWPWKDPRDGVDLTSIGYLFVGGPLVVTCVFTAASDTVASHEPEWETILGTFQLNEAAIPSPTTSASGALSHDDPELEALLPGEVAGRMLWRWSVRGAAALRLWGLSGEQVDTASEALVPLSVELEDVAQATAGRADPGDPPYFVLAFRIPSAARDLLGGHAIAGAGFTRDTDAWDLEERVVGDKTVGVGGLDLLVQTERQRGKPYLYGSVALDVSFIVITDDETWAEEAIRKLPG